MRVSRSLILLLRFICAPRGKRRISINVGYGNRRRTTLVRQEEPEGDMVLYVGAVEDPLLVAVGEILRRNELQTPSGSRKREGLGLTARGGGCSPAIRSVTLPSRPPARAQMTICRAERDPKECFGSLRVGLEGPSLRPQFVLPSLLELQLFPDSPWILRFVSFLSPALSFLVSLPHRTPSLLPPAAAGPKRRSRAII